MAGIAAVALFTAPTVWADNAASAPSETVTSSGASVGSPTNETPKPSGHSQESAKGAPVALGSNEKGERNPTAASTDGAKPGAPEGITTPGTSNGPSVGSATLQTPKPDGHSENGAAGQPVAKPDDRK